MTAAGRDVLSALAIGVGASLLMDAWNLFLKLALGIPSLNYCLLGRWLRHMPSGTFRHANISRARQMPLECMVGWIAHYTIGAGLAVGFLVVVSREWLLQPALLPAVLWGVGTVMFPLFVMQPALGLGVAASKTPNPTQARVKSLASHTVFGIGLYSCANALNYLLRAHG
jgi:hypothetical protein